MKKTSSFLYGLILIVGLGIFAFVVCLIFVGEFTLPDERTYTDTTVENYSEGWERVHWDGSSESIALPGNYEPEGSHEFVLRKKLEVWQNQDSYISFNSNKQDVDAYVDDELRYSFFILSN